MVVELPEEMNDIVREIAIDNKCAGTSGVVESVIGKGKLPEIGGIDGATRMPGCVTHFVEQRWRERLGFEDGIGRIKKRRRQNREDQAATF